MTLDEFFVELKKCKNLFDWKIAGELYESIRGTFKKETVNNCWGIKACFCPITAVVYNKTGEFYNQICATLIGNEILHLSSLDIKNIINASDRKIGDPIREQLECILLKE